MVSFLLYSSFTHSPRENLPVEFSFLDALQETYEESERQKATAGAKIKEQYKSYNTQREAKKAVIDEAPVGPSKKRRSRNSAAVPPGGIKSKGQSILQKARSGSKAAKRFTDPVSSRASERPKLKAPRGVNYQSHQFSSSHLGNSAGNSTSDEGKRRLSQGTYPAESSQMGSASSPLQKLEFGFTIGAKEPEAVQVKALNFFGSSSATSAKSPPTLTSTNGKFGNRSTLDSPTVSTSKKRKAEEPPPVVVSVSKKARSGVSSPPSSKSQAPPPSSISQASNSKPQNSSLVKSRSQSPPKRSTQSSSSTNRNVQSTSSNMFPSLHSNPSASKAASSIFMPRSNFTSQMPQDEGSRR